MSEEESWNFDLIEILKTRLNSKFKIVKGKVLKDIFFDKQKNGIQLGFMEQDIIIYKEELDIGFIKKSKSFYTHNNPRYKLIIPIVIIELKYRGINTYTLCTCSVYASDFKSIFPDCKYLMLMRFRESSSESKLTRHGRYFDRTFCLSERSTSKGKYKRGDFEKQLEEKTLKANFDKFIDYLSEILKKK